MTASGDALNRNRLAYRSAVGVAIVAGCFSIVVAVLMAAAHFQLAARPSLEMPIVERLRSNLRERPTDDALKQEIRDLDLLARRAYFTNLNALQTGGVLLLFGLLATLVSLRLVVALRRPLPDPRQYGPATDRWENAAAGRWSVASAAAILIVATAVLALLVGRDLRARSLASVAQAVAAKPAPVPGAPGDGMKPVAPTPAVPVSGEQEMLKNWPCFRGPGGMGVAHTTNAPLAWDGKSGSNILWKAAVPRSGFNSPVVWGKRLVLAGADKVAREVYCYDADTGQLRWRKTVTGVPGSPAELPEVSADTGFAAPTMATDGRHAFVIFATADIAGFDLEGRQIWGRNLGVPTNNYGHASSLITFGNLLIVPFDSGAGGRVLALDAATGNTVWDLARPNVQNSWASPIIANTGKRMELILNSAPLVAGYDPMTGRELWSVDCMGGEVAASAAYAGGTVFVANEYVRAAAVRLEGTPKMVWEYAEDLPSVSSPVATDQFLFMASSGGMVTCLDAKTGALRWKHEFQKGFYSSPIVAGDRLYLMDIEGVTHVMAVAPEFRLLAESDLGEPSVCTPAFVDGRIYIRGKENLYCIGQK